MGARRGDLGVPEMGGKVEADSLYPARHQGAGRPCSSEAHLQQVAQAALALLVDEVLALGERGTAEFGAGHGLALGHHHSLAIQLQLGVLGWICRVQPGPRGMPGSLTGP